MIGAESVAAAVARLSVTSVVSVRSRNPGSHACNRVLVSAKLRNATCSSPCGCRAWLSRAVTLSSIDLKKEVIAFASRGNSERPTGVILTRDGEVWTWGKILGAHTQPNQKLQTVSKALEKLRWRNQLGKSKPMIRQKAWVLPNEG